MAWWSETQTDKLALMAEHGHSAREIGRAIGVSRNAVIGRAHRLGIKLGDKLQPLSLERIRVIVVMMESGFSSRAIGEQIGVHHQTVCSYYRRWKDRRRELFPQPALPPVPKNDFHCQHEECRNTRQRGTPYCARHHTQLVVKPEERPRYWNGLKG